MKKFEQIPAKSPETLTYDKISRLWEEGFKNINPIIAKSGRLVLGTDMGEREDNEDLAVLDTEADMVGVVDGMGGYEHGKLAAEILGKEILAAAKDSNVSAQEMQKRAVEKMKETGMRRGGACYAVAKIEKKKLITWHAGDVRVIVIDQKGKVKFTTEDTSLRYAPLVNPGQVTQATVNKTEIMNYDRIVIASDGVWKNVVMEEALKTIQGKPIQQSIKELEALSLHGMNNQLSTNSWGSKDNVTIAIYEILPVPLRGKK